MRVVAAAQHRRHLTISDTRDAVLLAAQRVSDGVAGPDTMKLVAKLEKITGTGIVELGRLATAWRDA